MKTLKAIATNIIAAIGGVAIPLGEFDDSPGLSGIGLILIGLSIWLNLKNLKDKNQ